jgi:hypothetical protein
MTITIERRFWIFSIKKTHTGDFAKEKVETWKFLLPISRQNRTVGKAIALTNLLAIDSYWNVLILKYDMILKTGLNFNSCVVSICCPACLFLFHIFSGFVVVHMIMILLICVSVCVLFRSFSLLCWLECVAVFSLFCYVLSFILLLYSLNSTSLLL